MEKCPGLFFLTRLSSQHAGMAYNSGESLKSAFIKGKSSSLMKNLTAFSDSAFNLTKYEVGSFPFHEGLWLKVPEIPACHPSIALR